MRVNDQATKEYLTHFLAQLDDFMLKIFERDASGLKHMLEEDYDYRFSQVINDLLQKNKLDFSEDNKLKLERVLKKLRGEYTSIEIVKVDLAFEPSERFMAMLKNWIQNNIGSNVVLDLHVNPKLLGGALITYKGLYKDFSILDKVKNYDFGSIQLA